MSQVGMSKQLPKFRAYTRMVDGDKLKLLTFEDRWHFVVLLCLKGEGLLDKGDGPCLLMRKVAVQLGLDVRSLEEGGRRLIEVGLIDWQGKGVLVKIEREHKCPKCKG